MAKRNVKDIAADLDAISGAMTGAYGRQVARLAAELRGEQLEPTENELRERAAAEAAKIGDTGE